MYRGNYWLFMHEVDVVQAALAKYLNKYLLGRKIGNPQEIMAMISGFYNRDDPADVLGAFYKNHPDLNEFKSIFHVKTEVDPGNKVVSISIGLMK